MAQLVVERHWWQAVMSLPWWLRQAAAMVEANRNTFLKRKMEIYFPV